MILENNFNQFQVVNCTSKLVQDDIIYRTTHHLLTILQGLHSLLAHFLTCLLAPTAEMNQEAHRTQTLHYQRQASIYGTLFVPGMIETWPEPV